MNNVYRITAAPPALVVDVDLASAIKTYLDHRTPHEGLMSGLVAERLELTDPVTLVKDGVPVRFTAEQFLDGHGPGLHAEYQPPPAPGPPGRPGIAQP